MNTKLLILLLIPCANAFGAEGGGKKPCPRYALCRIQESPQVSPAKSSTGFSDAGGFSDDELGDIMSLSKPVPAGLDAALGKMDTSFSPGSSPRSKARESSLPKGKNGSPLRPKNIHTLATANPEPQEEGASAERQILTARRKLRPRSLNNFFDESSCYPSSDPLPESSPFQRRRLDPSVSLAWSSDDESLQHAMTASLQPQLGHEPSDAEMPPFELE